MALFKMDPAYGWTPGMLTIAGSFSPPATTGTANLPIVQNSLADPAVVNNGRIGPSAAIAPRVAKLTIIANPNYAALPAPGLAMLPTGMLGGTGASVNNSTYCLVLTGFPADIIQASAAIVPHVSNLSTVATQNAWIAGIDNVNKLVYLQVTTLANPPVLATLAAPSTVHFEIALKDGALTA